MEHSTFLRESQQWLGNLYLWGVDQIEGDPYRPCQLQSRILGLLDCLPYLCQVSVFDVQRDQFSLSVKSSQNKKKGVTLRRDGTQFPIFSQNVLRVFSYFFKSMVASKIRRT
jgi:hypothetical protein